MPVHRHLHDRMGSVYAHRVELDNWARSRNPTASANGNGALYPASMEAVVTEEPTGKREPESRRWRVWWLALPAALAGVVLGIVLWLQKSEYFWKNPIDNARFRTLTDFDGMAEAAAVSRDGNLVAFLSDKDGPMDVWVTQTGSGEFHNLTHGRFPGSRNPSIRTVGFSPDASLVSFWIRKPNDSGGENTGTWGVPTLGGEPRPYLDGVAEFDWSRDRSQLAFHTSAPGDPLFVSKDGQPSDGKLLFKAASGLHSHFPLWSPDGSFLYFVGGSIPDKLDLWRIPSGGGTPQRITYHDASVMYPVNLDDHTLLYLATDADGSGPWIYGLDVRRGVPHRLTPGPVRYTSLAISEDGRRLATTIASPKKTLWRLSLAGAAATQPAPLPLSTVTVSAPRLGPNYLLYVSTAGPVKAFGSSPTVQTRSCGRPLERTSSVPRRYRLTAAR